MRRLIQAAVVAAVAAAGGMLAQVAPAHASPMCDRPKPPPACDTGGPGLPPRGKLGTATRVPAGVAVTGQAEDPDGGNVRVDITIGGKKAGSVTAGADGRFSGTVPAVVGGNVCATAINNGPGHDVGIGCVPLAVGVDPVGSFDRIDRSGTTVTLHGWALDPDTAGAVDVQVLQNGSLVATTRANRALAAAPAGYAAYGTAHGFTVQLPEHPSDGEHTICVRALNVGAGSVNTQLGCRTYTVRHDPIGTVDEVTRVGGTVRVRGWAVDPDEPRAPVQVEIYEDGALVRTVTASAHRPELGPEYGPAHGFDVTDLPATMRPGAHTICVQAVNRSHGGNDRVQLGCRDYTVPVPVPTPVIEPFGQWSIYSTSIALRWAGNTTGVTGYRVERSTGGAWQEIYRGRADIRWLTDRDVTPATRYCYRVIAFNEASQAASETCATTLHPALPKPSGLTVVAEGEASLQIRWNDNAEGEDSYVVGWRPVGEETWKNVTIPANPGTGVMTYTIKGLTSSTHYEFGVLPRRAGHDTGESLNGTAWTKGAPKVESFTSSPAAVQACVNAKITLSWRTTGANRVVVKRGDATLYDKTQNTVASWTGEVAGGTHDGNVAYTLTAYGPDGRTTTATVGVQRASAYPLLAALEFTNTGWYQLEAWYFDLQGNPIKKIADVPSGGRTLIRPEHCTLARIQVIDPNTRRVAFNYPTIVLGHKEGHLDQRAGG
ncbi:fibronectin type III domain-containing protein [Polymorphospora sp. NPDC050346]|uniref:fibronectin type III domain-containing protein n=1 Tax=Polymorphospora sp. NPDC050346 TaxID=3155780 RepID=UPI003403CF41